MLHLLPVQSARPCTPSLEDELNTHMQRQAGGIASRRPLSVLTADFSSLQHGCPLVVTRASLSILRLLCVWEGALLPTVADLEYAHPLSRGHVKCVYNGIIWYLSAEQQPCMKNNIEEQIKWSVCKQPCLDEEGLLLTNLLKLYINYLRVHGYMFRTRALILGILHMA